MVGRREGGGRERCEEENRITESSNEKFMKEVSEQVNKEATFIGHRAERIRIMGMSYLYLSFYG
jgi:hypothetical protein